MSKINPYTLSSILRNCFTFTSINQAKQTHTQLLVNGFLPNITLETDLLLAYSRCKFLKEAQRVFDEMTDRNMHSWNILISSYVQNSLHYESLTHFYQFLNMGFRPDHFTFPSIFKACAAIEDSRLGKTLHTCVIKIGLQSHFIVGSSLLDFYGKCRNLIDAHSLFMEMPVRDIVVWNSMICAFARCGVSLEALVYFRKMQGEGVKMDSRTIPSILSACGREGDLMRGKEIHGQVIKNFNFSTDVVIGNCLIDMYAKCGCLPISLKVFREMRNVSLVTWTTLISCYGVHGKGEEALILFEKMKASGVRPNCVTFTATLSSCSHSGLIDQGRAIFNSMSSDYGIDPSIEHYACMVDLLGRFGLLEEAFELIETLQGEATASIWGALLGACRIQNNIEMGEVAANQLFELEPGNASNYIALCSIYESVGRLDGVLRIRSRMKELGLIKTPGCSWITIKGRVYKFFQGEIALPRMKMVYETLDMIIKRMMLPQGYGWLFSTFIKY